MQKAAVLNKINEFPKIENIPDDEVSDDELIIEQEETGICYRDILTMKGFFPRVQLPIVPGHEISGRVRKVGSKVTKFKIGDRVASLIYIPCGECEYCKSGRENLCRNKKTFGEIINGAYRKYVKTKEISLVKVPDGVPEEAAVISACVTGMIIQALETVGEIKEGNRVLVTGSGGGVGAHAIQIAKAFGAEVIAETSSDWKAEFLKKLGVDHVVSKDNMAQKIKELTNGEGVDISLETVGAPTFTESFRSLKFGGRVVVIGNVDVTPVSLPLGNLILKGNSIRGSISSTRKDMIKALEWSRIGKIKPIVGKIYKMDQINEAYNDMENKKIFGRAFIKL